MTAQTSFKSANQFLREGKLDAAVAAYREAIAVNPNFQSAHHNLGEALVKAGRVDEAVAAFRQAVELNPQAVWSLFKLGELLRRRERFEEAVGFFRRAVELKSDVAEFNLALGAALVKLGSALEEAEACLRRAVELNPFLAEAYYYLGVAASGRQQWSEAVEFYNRGLELNPSGVECGLGLAEALGKLGRWSEAVEKYRQRSLASGESGEVCFGLGQALGQLGKWEEAVVEYRRAVALGFAGAPVLHHLGYALGQLGRWEEAVVEFRLVLEINPKSASVRHQLGYGLMQLQHWGEAEIELRKATELYPGSAVVWQQLGDVLRELGKREEAIEVYRKVLEIEPQRQDAEEKLVRLLDRQATGKLERDIINRKDAYRSIKDRGSKVVREFHGSIDSFDRYNARGWVAGTELAFNRVRLFLENLDLGAIPISQAKTDPDLEFDYPKARFVAHLGGILQFSAANLRRCQISLIPDKKDLKISKVTPVKAEIGDFWQESITFNPLFCNQERAEFPVALQSISLIDANEVLCIFVSNQKYPKKEIKIVFIQENDCLSTTNRELEVVGDFQCSLSSEFLPLRIHCQKLVNPLLIVVKDLNDVILFADCIPYPNLLSKTNQLFIEHLCLFNNMPKNRALSRLSLQIITNQVKFNRRQEFDLVIVDLFNTQMPTELGTARENIDLLALKDCYLYQLVNPSRPFKGFQLISYGKESDVDRPLEKIEDVSLLKSFITKNFKSKYTLLVDKHTTLRPDFCSFVREYFESKQEDSVGDFIYWNSLVYPIGKTPLLFQRSSFVYPEVAINDGVPIFSALVSTEFLAEHLEDFLKLDRDRPQLSGLMGMAEPSKVKFIGEYLETVEVPIPHISNHEAPNLPESRIKIGDRPEIMGFKAIPTQEKSLLLSQDTYKQFTQLKGISIIINFRDKKDLTNLCLESIKMQKFVPEIQIILVNNRSKVEERQSVLETACELFGKAAVKIIDYDSAFNHSEQCNLAAREADRDVLVLMNNDVILGSEDLLTKLSAYSLLPNVATVGCKMLAKKSANSYSLKSAGMFFRPQPTAAFGGGIVGEYVPPDFLTNKNYSCLGNTFALAFIPQQVYWSLNGLDGVNFPTDYNDVDFCIRAIEEGLNHIVINDCIAIHNGRASQADTGEYPASLKLMSSIKNLGLLTKPTNFYPLT